MAMASLITKRLGTAAADGDEHGASGSELRWDSCLLKKDEADVPPA
jgi:hypothetical protein